MNIEPKLKTINLLNIILTLIILSFSFNLSIIYNIKEYSNLLGFWGVVFSAGLIYNGAFAAIAYHLFSKWYKK